jgi:signal transduction histidine kinase
MATIYGFSNLLQKRDVIKNKTRRNKYLKIMESEIKRLAKLVNDVLDLSRIDLGTLRIRTQKVDIKKLVEDVKNEMEQIAKNKGLKLYLKVDSNLPKIITDNEKLKEILINLIDNSIKYTEKGNIKIEVLKTDGYIEFRIIDTGIGIAKKYFKYIFDRFYQVESTYTRKVKGTGLGLSICKEFIEKLGGKIWLKSRVGRGTTFYFTLPLKFKLSK